MMIKYLEPREFYCAVITAFIGPFSFCLRGHLCLLSAQPRLKWFQLLLQKGCLWGLKISEICGGAGREGQQHSWRGSALCQLCQPQADGDLIQRHLEQIQLQKQLRFLENKNKREEGERETQPGTGKALKRAHGAHCTLLLEGSEFDFPGLFLYWEKQSKNKFPAVGRFGGG